MLMNILNLIINQLMGRASANEAPAGLFPNFTLASLRKLLMICAGLGGSLVLFFGGFLTVLMDLILSSREYGQLMLSPASIVGFSLIGISFIFMATLFSRRMWKTPPHFRSEAVSSPSPVQEAMADLIRDFVEERRMAREFTAEQMAAAAAAAAAMNSESPVTQTAIREEPAPASYAPIYN